MAKLISGAGLLGGVLLLCAAMVSGDGGNVPGPDGAAAVSHQAGVNFLHLLGEEYEAAALMSDREARNHIDDRQVVLRKSVLFQPLNDQMAVAAYGENEDEEFNQERFARTMRAIASGLKSVR